jgi:hypothetical protein
MKVDMSAKSVTARLLLTSQLRRLCLSLSKARPVEPSVEPGAKEQSSNRDQSRYGVNELAIESRG